MDETDGEQTPQIFPRGGERRQRPDAHQHRERRREQRREWESARGGGDAPGAEGQTNPT